MKKQKFKIMKNMERLKNCHRLEETKHLFLLY